ncbi:uncharacterized protein LOC132268467 [Cornus florida]|uniref:uncharacterized protein LOC132268467 n=1 Tax=Cornus florida TaxID=4283 RepID=UPI0028A000CA|nr:uncharacterized protein LOC132268467 [Cornus florida]
MCHAIWEFQEIGTTYAQSREEVLKNRMRLKATIEIVCLLTLQGIGFRGHDESSSSLNRGNFIEVLKCEAEGNDELSSVILDNAPQNAQYIAPSIQKEVIHILTNRVRKVICDEIAGEGTGRHCQQQDHITVEHHYHFDIFNYAIDLQSMELEHRFNNEVVELLTLSSALDPNDSFKSFNVEKICNLAEKFYPWDFTGQDVKTLKF